MITSKFPLLAFHLDLRIKATCILYSVLPQCIQLCKDCKPLRLEGISFIRLTVTAKIHTHTTPAGITVETSKASRCWQNVTSARVSVVRTSCKEHQLVCTWNSVTFLPTATQKPNTKTSVVITDWQRCNAIRQPCSIKQAEIDVTRLQPRLKPPLAWAEPQFYIRRRIQRSLLMYRLLTDRKKQGYCIQKSSSWEQMLKYTRNKDERVIVTGRFLASRVGS